MSMYQNFSEPKKNLVNRLISSVIKAASPDDPTGHLPNCGYTAENEMCNCSDFGTRLREAIIEEVATLPI